MMLWVLVCLMPGIALSTYFLGLGILLNLVLCCLTGFFCELGNAKLRQTHLAAAWDGSGFVTATLFALCLPPDVAWHLVCFGAMFAIIFGKLVYGGLGHNPFNPAMVGYCAMIVCFPLAMSNWPVVVDGSSGATVLDTLHWRSGATIEEVWQTDNGFGRFAGYSYEWIATAYLLGGVSLIGLKVIKWQAPVAFLSTLALLSILFYDNGGSSSLGSPLFHIFAGGAIFAAFFIITDPVTTPDDTRGMMYFAVGAACLTFIIRSNGGYPDGIAFGVLLMNALVPLYEHVRLKKA